MGDFNERISRVRFELNPSKMKHNTVICEYSGQYQEQPYKLLANAVIEPDLTQTLRFGLFKNCTEIDPWPEFPTKLECRSYIKDESGNYSRYFRDMYQDTDKSGRVIFAGIPLVRVFMHLPPRTLSDSIEFLEEAIFGDIPYDELIHRDFVNLHDHVVHERDL